LIIKVETMTDYQLKVFEPYEKGEWAGKYRIAVIDPQNFKGYPANFICLLPRIMEKGKPESVFERLFGEKSSQYATELLREALKQEINKEAKSEIQKRLRLLELKKPKVICSECQQEFEEYSKIRYKRRLCQSCLEKRYLQPEIETKVNVW
jgi:hypothetical protein